MKTTDFYKIIPHREGIDPEGYCVGILNEKDEQNLKGYFINEASGEISEYLNTTEWLDISRAYSDVIPGKLFVEHWIMAELGNLKDLLKI